MGHVQTTDVELKVIVERGIVLCVLSLSILGYIGYASWP